MCDFVRLVFIITSDVFIFILFIRFAGWLILSAILAPPWLLFIKYKFSGCDKSRLMLDGEVYVSYVRRFTVKKRCCSSKLSMESWWRSVVLTQCQQERRINMFEEIRDRVLRANLALAEHGLVTLTWGNVSEIDRNEGIIAIKPSGVKYETMRAEDIVILDPDGKKIDGNMNPCPIRPHTLSFTRAFRPWGRWCIHIPSGQRFLPSVQCRYRRSERPTPILFSAKFPEQEN